MKRVFFAFILLLALDAVLAGWFSSDPAPTVEKGGKKKKADLAALTKEEGWVRLAPGDFNRLVMSKKNRTYSVVTFLTASEGCEPCQVVEEQFQIVANEFRKQHPAHAGLYFVELRLEDSRSTFIDLKAQTLPTILHIPPVKKGRRDFIYDEKHDVHALMSNQGWTATGIANFVFDRAGVAVDVPKAFLSHRHGGGSAARFAFLGVSDNTVIYAGVVLLLVTGAWRHFFPYFFIILVVWYTMVSGLVYNIITDPPPYQAGRDGARQYFHSSSHAQYGLEGFIMGSMVVGIGGIILVANEALPVLSARIASKASSGKRTVASLVLNLTAIALMVFSYFIFLGLKDIYKRKMGGYPF